MTKLKQKGELISTGIHQTLTRCIKLSLGKYEFIFSLCNIWMVFVISKCNNFINLPLRFAQQSRLFSVSWHPQFCKDQISLRQKQHLRESLTIKGGLTCRSQSGPFHSPHHLIRTQLESEDLPLYNFERTSDSMCHPEKVKKIRNMHKMISGK